MKVLISKKTGSYYYINPENDYHCKEGIISKEDLNSQKKIVKSHTEREFLLFDANFIDLKKKKMKRGPQIITEKDLGYILARSGIGKNSYVVEAGGGSGGATLFFANIVKNIHTYEIREEHCDIINKNIESFGFDNVKVTNADLATEIDNEKDIDMLFLDMPEPNMILEKELNSVKSGAFIVCYVPSISQIQEITKLVGERVDLYLEEITEVILRHWRVWEKVSRPEHRKEIDHTAFLVFIRKI